MTRVGKSFANSSSLCVTLSTLIMAAVEAPGCHAPPSELPDGTVLRYGVSHISGSVSVHVASDGSAEVVRTEGVEEERHQATLSAEELGALAETMRENDCCSLRSRRDTGVPDEARPSFEVRLEGLDCRVVMWDNEILHDSDARVCFATMSSLAQRIAPTTPPR